MKSQSIVISFFISLSSLAVANPVQHLAESGISPDSKDLITIQPHTRSAAVNAKHAAECAAMGGVDVTDEKEMQVGLGITDYSICKIVDNNKYNAYKSVTTNNQLKQTCQSGKKEDGTYRYCADARSVYSYEFPLSFSTQYHLENNTSKDDYGPNTSVIVDQILFVDDAGNKHSSYCRVQDRYILPVLPPHSTTDHVINGFCDPRGPELSDPYWFGYKPGIHEAYGLVSDVATIKVDTEGYFSLEKNMGEPNQPLTCNLPSPFVGNPINIATGNKYQKEVDISDFGAAYPLNFIKVYNSSDGIWRHNYSDHLDIRNYDNGIHQIALIFNDGRTIIFSVENNQIISSPTEFGSLKRTSSGYEYISRFQDKYDFDHDGRLIRLVTSNGLTKNYQYVSNNEVKVSDLFGHVLTIKETINHQPLSVKSSSGAIVDYEYDNKNRLIKMIKNNKSRTYHYEDARFPKALTGITDENGIRYASWAYDDKGRANLSKHYGNNEEIKITYTHDFQTMFINPLGRTYVYRYAGGCIDGLKLAFEIFGNASSTCPQINTFYNYNDRGLVTLKTDGKGIKTSYSYDNLGQEYSRTIGVGTAEALTIKTTWDNRFNKPKTETYPDKIITYEYDNDGNLIDQNVQSN